MNNLKLYDRVELLEDLVEGRDFISSYHKNYTKGSIGTVIEIINDDWVEVEFSYKEYDNPVISIKVSKLKLLNRQK